MTDKEIITSFWIFEDNLISLFLLLSKICSYNFQMDDLETIKYGIAYSSNEQNLWFDYQLIGKKIISLNIAKDQENRDMIFVNLKTEPELTSQIELIEFVMDSFSLRPLHFNEH